jgi:CubicO group peptidase (beta-lactamase class C family)
MMQDWNRNIQRKIGDSTLSVYKACHLWFSTRDMARIGYLMLRKGSWQQQRVLSPGWVNKMTTPVTQAEETIKNHSDFFHLSYGYLWWIWNSKEDGKYFKGAYTASGAFGQFITVLPALDVVVAHKTNYESYGRKTHPETYLNMLKALVDAKIF